jgi:hypothetical protein
VLAGVFAAALVAPLPARACTLLDLTCASSTSGGTAPGTVDDAGAAVGDSLGSDVDDTVGSASGTVDDVANTVDDALDDALGEVSPPTEPGTDPPGPTPTDQDRRRGRDEPERVLGRPGAPSGVVSAGPRHPVAPVAPVPSPVAASPSASRSPTRAGFGNVLAAAAPSLVVLVALFGLVMAFLLVQSWVDRRDPRLSAAAPADEMAWFR